MIILIFLLMAIAITFILIGVTSSPRFSSRRVALPKDESQMQGKEFNAYIVSALPFSKKLLEKTKFDVKIKNRLDAARLNITVTKFICIKLVLMILAGALSFYILRRFEPLVLFAACAVAYFLPELWLNNKVRQRKYAIARVLPETVDLLGLCVEAGLDFTTAVKWVVEKKISTNPMIEELSAILEEIKWGKPRSSALKDMAKRLNIPEVSSFTQALIQAERMGTPISEAFGIISEDTRLQRFRRGERYALKAPIKILIPLIFCILPVIGIIIGGPILLQFTQGGLFTGFGK